MRVPHFIIATVLLLLPAAPVWSQTANPRILRDIGFVEASSEPANLFASGDVVYFTTTNGFGQRQVWRTDGSITGTLMVKTGLAAVTEFAPYGNLVIFAAEDVTNGHAIWKSNGSMAGTLLVKGLMAGPLGSTTGSPPRDLTLLSSSIYFRAGDTAQGTLWRTNGTTAGTVEVKPDFDVHPANLTVMGSTLYFQATVDAPTGGQLWKSNGTPAGTVAVLDPGAAGTTSNPNWLTPAGSTLYYVTSGTEPTDYAVWKTNGTQVGTSKVWTAGSADADIGNLTMVGTTLYFTANDQVHGRELWKSNGTSAGTALVADIVPGADGSNVKSLTAAGNTLFFAAETPGAGLELWKTDGTTAGTVMVKDIMPGGNGSDPSRFVAVGNTLYFVTETPEEGLKLRKSNGTDAGTVIVGDYDYLPQFTPEAPVAAGGRLYYTSSTPESGVEVWVLDLLRAEFGATTATPGSTSVTVHSSINPNGLFTIANIEYGTTTAYGLNLPVPLSPADGTSSQPVTINIPGLEPSTEYHYRLIATNSQGTMRTEDFVVTTLGNLTPQQAWRLEHFGSIENTGDGADDADADQDGQNNKLEFLAGTLPKERSSALTLDVAGPPEPAGTLRMGPVRPGVRYIVQVRNDETGEWEDQPAVQYDAPAESVTVTDPGAASKSRRIYRLRLELIE